MKPLENSTFETTFTPIEFTGSRLQNYKNIAIAPG
jgi:hypothetical protein